MTEKLLVPDIGEFQNVEVIELLVKEGQKINKNDPIVTIESDKSSVEIPSTIEGTIDKIEVKIGDKVSKGDLLLLVSSKDKPQSIKETVPKYTENLIKSYDNNFICSKISSTFCMNGVQSAFKFSLLFLIVSFS